VSIATCAVVGPRSGVTPANPVDLKETGHRWLGLMADQRNLRKIA
jgi:hypothetical protein